MNKLDEFFEVLANEMDHNDKVLNSFLKLAELMNEEIDDLKKRMTDMENRYNRLRRQNSQVNAVSSIRIDDK